MTVDAPPRDDPNWRRAHAWLAARSDALRRDVAVLGVPAYRTSLSPTGAQATPAAIRAALQHYSTSGRGVDLESISALDLGDLTDPDDDEAATTAAAAQAMRRARLLVALGGDNSITFAVARGVLGEGIGKGGLVTLDAHHDLRDGVSNGSPVRRLVDEAGLSGAHVVQIGISDFANGAAYAARAKTWGIQVVTRDEVADRGIALVMREALAYAGSAGGPVFVDLDVDVCDRSVAPGCPGSTPGGLSARELRIAAHLAGRDPWVRGIAITEVDATADAPDGRTVRLAALCLLEAAAGLALR